MATLMVSRIVIILTVLLRAVPVFAQVPPTLGWHTLAGTALKPTHCPSAATYPNQQGASGCQDVTAGWSGGAFDSARNRLIVFGGGHAGYYGNELYAIDLDTLTSSRLTDPGPVGQIADPTNHSQCNSASQQSGNQPSSRHTEELVCCSAQLKGGSCVNESCPHAARQLIPHLYARIVSTVGAIGDLLIECNPCIRREMKAVRVSCCSPFWIVALYTCVELMNGIGWAGDPIGWIRPDVTAWSCKPDSTISTLRIPLRNI